MVAALVINLAQCGVLGRWELLLILAVVSFYSAKRSRSPFAEGLRKGWDKLREASRGVAEEISTRDYE
jgi:hypothetical protein